MKGLVDILSTIFDYKAGSSEGLRLLKTRSGSGASWLLMKCTWWQQASSLGIQVSRYAPDTDLPFQGFDAYGNPVLRLAA